MDQEQNDNYHPEYAKYCDHTVLKAYTKREVVKAFCDEAIKYGVASVCVNPIHVSYVKDLLDGTGIQTCTVIGFPLGANTPAVKAFEAAEAAQNGADELDMVINIGALRDGNTELVYQDIRCVVEAAGGKTVKVIIETCYLSDEEKKEACRISLKAGADFVKTSTGFGTRGASVEDILLMKSIVAGHMKIKASGGIKTLGDAEKLIKAGASRLGVSSTVQIIEGAETLAGASGLNKVPVG